jgi:chromosome transmission fidelity protein 18
MKEADTTVHAALNSLFAPLTRKRAKELGLSEMDETKYVGRLCQEVEATGKLSTVATGDGLPPPVLRCACSSRALATGCFTHYATLRHHDVNFSRYEKAVEWLGVFDTFSSAMYSDGDFDLSPYLPFLLAPFFPLFQERGAPTIERSHTDWDVRQSDSFSLSHADVLCA